MGGRGSKSKVSTRQNIQKAVAYTPPPVQRNQPRTNKTQQEIIDFVSQQTGVNLNDYRDDQTAMFERPRSNFVNVDWKNMPKAVQQYLNNLSIMYPGSSNAIALADTSAWSKMIYFKNR